MAEIVTAAMLVIGDEILSGRTKDRNIGHLADIMTAIGIDLKEVRIVADEEDEIADAVNALRARYDYVFTTGGIGPTHDDITADSIAKAFGVPCEYDAKALCAAGGAATPSASMEFTEARKRMARMPRGAEHIDNPVSVAPGFRIGNVHVMAGVPAIFQAMLDNVVPTLQDRHQTALGDGALPVRRRRDRRAAGRHPESASRHDHRLLSEISGRQVLDRARGARAQRGGAGKRARGGRGDGCRASPRLTSAVNRPEQRNKVAGQSSDVSLPSAPQRLRSCRMEAAMTYKTIVAIIQSPRTIDRLLDGGRAAGDASSAAI